MGDRLRRLKMSYMEQVNEVTLHKLVDGAWQTEPETVRIDIMHDSAQSMFYVIAQTPSGKFPIRTYITAEVAQHYVPSDPQFHTWWIPDEQSNLQAWSLMFQTVEDATKLHAKIMAAASGQPPPRVRQAQVTRVPSQRMRDPRRHHNLSLWTLLR